MKFLLTYLLLGLIMLAAQHGYGQEQQDSLKESLPKLEIPELTIIGKKAITLPFARKGEIYDVQIFEASPPDSSLLGQRSSSLLPLGSLPRFEERLKPWRISGEGGLGSFGALNGPGYIDRKSTRL